MRKRTDVYSWYKYSYYWHLYQVTWWQWCRYPGSQWYQGNLVQFMREGRRPHLGTKDYSKSHVLLVIHGSWIRPVQLSITLFPVCHLYCMEYRAIIILIYPFIRIRVCTACLFNDMSSYHYPLADGTQKNEYDEDIISKPSPIIYSIMNLWIYYIGLPTKISTYYLKFWLNIVSNWIFVIFPVF